MMWHTHTYIYIYAGWWFQPLWKIWKSVESQLGWLFPIYGKHVPNHQPVWIYIYMHMHMAYLLQYHVWNHCRTQAPSAFGAPCHSADSPDVALHWSWLQRRPALQVTSARGKMKALTVWPGEKWWKHGEKLELQYSLNKREWWGKMELNELSIENTNGEHIGRCWICVSQGPLDILRTPVKLHPMNHHAMNHESPFITINHH